MVSDANHLRYSEFDPIEDTESPTSVNQSSSGSYSYSEFDPIERVGHGEQGSNQVPIRFRLAGTRVPLI